MVEPTGTTIVLTGASAGIGAAAAIVLAGRGHELVLVGRSPSKLAAVTERAAAAAGRPVRSHVCDFARLDEVRATATAIAAEYAVIDVLVDNAGLIAGTRQTTVDGHDQTIQVNHLAPYLLTTLLLDRVLAAPAGRIVTTSSSAHSFGRLDPDDLDFTRRRWSRWRSYCDSKQANILFTTELTWRLRDTPVVATSFHPGAVRSDFGADLPVFRLLSRVLPVGFVTPSQAAQALIQLADGEAGRSIPGGYFSGQTLSRATSRAVDPELAARLWEVSARVTAAVG